MCKVSRLFKQFSLLKFTFLFFCQGEFVYYINANVASTNPNNNKNTHKMFHISPLIVLFCYGKVKDIFWDKDQISLLSEIQTLSHKLLVRQTSSSHYHCDQYAQKLVCKNFQVILNSSSWSKKCSVFLRNKYGSQIGNAMEKYEYYKQDLSLPVESTYISLK